MAPFPLCCITGMVSADAAGFNAAFLTGLASGGAFAALSQVAPLYKDPTVPVPELLSDYKKHTAHSRKVQKKLVMGGLVAAAAAAAINSSKEASIPLGLSAALSTASVALTVFLMRPVNDKLAAASEKLVAASPAASPGKNKKSSQLQLQAAAEAAAEAEAEVRQQLGAYVKLSKARTALSFLAFGSALCGVLLLNKHK